MKRKLTRRESWCLQSEIAFEDIAPFLTETEYDDLREEWPSVPVLLYFWITPADSSVGLVESVVFDEWVIPDDFPACIVKAVASYFDTFDPAERYRQAVVELREDYYDGYEI